MASASDATDAVSSLINAVAKGKRAIERQAAIEDPKCRKAVRKFVEKHPLVARWFAPELRDMSGVDIGCACNSVGAADVESFANRYADELTRQRAAHGYEGAECEPSPEEDRAVIGALMVPLGLSKEEEDNVYAAASRTAATALDMYLPGAGARATEASDAISQLITGRKMAPHSEAPRAPAPKAPGVDQTKKLKAQLVAEKAKVAVVKEFVREHPHVVSWFNPDLRKIQGVDSSPTPPVGATSPDEWQYYACVAGKQIQIGPSVPDLAVGATDVAVATAYRLHADKAACSALVSGRVWRVKIVDETPDFSAVVVVVS
jgi:hypothetical protein